MSHKFLLILAAAVCFTAQAQQFPYQDKALSPEERAEDLISRLTLKEKTALLMHRSEAVPHLGIPGYNWWNEALHGVARNGSATCFPQPIGMAASFDEDLLYEVFTAASDEARVKHREALEEGSSGQYQGLTFWTPNINIFRDPRWGRGMETYGEDPYLTGRMGMAVVRGLQGPDDSPIRKALACAKHYAVHSGPETSRHRIDVSVSRRDLHETYLPAFKDLVTKAGVGQVMIAYNRFEGKPCGVNDYLIDTLLRGDWGYTGLVVSDCWAIADFYVKGRHEYVEDGVTAAALAVKAGVDVECGDAYRYIPEAVRRGLLSEEDIDRNLKRALAARFRLGEIDGTDPWKDLPESIVEGPEHLTLALKMAEESLVLLHNDGILPLSGGKIALIGPNADDPVMQWGNYKPIPSSTVTLRKALEDRLGDGLTCVKGCGHVEDAEPLEDILAKLDGIETVIFAGGIAPYLEGEQNNVKVPGFEGGDRTDVEFPRVQRELTAALHDAGKKVILVNFSGCAINLGPETASCSAILQAWYPGQTGGTAIANAIFGEVNPSGKLPVTFYASADELPDFENYDMEGRTYRFFRGKPLFPFGYGLSYTTFKFGRARVRNGRLVFTLRNTGRRDGTETVQLYLSRPDDPQGPVRTLRAFRRVDVKAGKKVKVEIPLDPETFLWWNGESGRMEPLAGKYLLWYGSSSDKAELRKVKFSF